MKRREIRVKEALFEIDLPVKEARMYIQNWLNSFGHGGLCPNVILCKVCLAAFPSLGKELDILRGTSTTKSCPCAVHSVEYVEKVVRQLLKEIQ